MGQSTNGINLHNQNLLKICKILCQFFAEIIIYKYRTRYVFKKEKGGGGRSQNIVTERNVEIKIVPTKKRQKMCQFSMKIIIYRQRKSNRAESHFNENRK